MILMMLVNMTLIDVSSLLQPLLVMAFTVSSLTMFCVAIMMIVQMNGVSVPDWLPVVVMIVCVFMFSGGVMPISYIMMTEMFNFQV